MSFTDTSNPNKYVQLFSDQIIPEKQEQPVAGFLQTNKKLPNFLHLKAFYWFKYFVINGVFVK